MFAAMSDIAGTPTCNDVSMAAAVPSDGQCFSGSSIQKAITLGLGCASGAIAGVAALARARAFAVAGRRGRAWPSLAIVLAAASSVGARRIVDRRRLGMPRIL